MDKKSKELAEMRMKIVGERLKRRFPILAVAINLLKFKAVDECIGSRLATNGEYVFFQADTVYAWGGIDNYKLLEMDLLHIVLHGLLGHFAIYNTFQNKKLIDVAMDREVEHIIECCCGEGCSRVYDEDMVVHLGECYDISCYYKGMKSKKTYKKMIAYGKGIMRDEHKFWKSEAIEMWKAVSEDVLGVDQKKDGKLLEALKYQSNFGNVADENSEKVIMEEKSVNSYYEVLMEHFKLKERNYEAPDSIDYMIYNYGFEMYGDVALIEPVEENEVLDIGTVCIAIDTSGSCSGKVASSFLGETYGILQEMKEKNIQTDLYFWECDCELQAEKYYENVADIELSEWQEKELHGWGGTSFIPVFQRIDEIIKKGKNIDCLIYLTDGWGDYPEEKPNYPVYFVFPEQIWSQDCENEMIPKWINKIFM